MTIIPKSKVMNTLVFIPLFLAAVVASAQDMDPSVLGLVGESEKSSRREQTPQSQENFENSRYIRKHKPKKNKTPGWPPRKPATQAPAKEEPVAQPAMPESTAPQVAPLPTLTSGTFNNAATPAPEPVVAKEKDGGMGAQMRDLVLGGDLEEIDKYRSILDPEDIRKNLFEFSASPTYIYNSSLSPYYYRNYINQSPGVYLGVNLWFTPFLGIVADYRFSMLNEIKDSPNQESYVASSHTWFDIGLKFRRFFGSALNSSSFAVALCYTDYSLSLPLNATRLKHGVSGVEVDIDVSIPSGKSYFWNMGLMVMPYLIHSEKVVGPNVRAGQSNQTIGFGASLGGEYRFVRQTRVFFNVSTILYKSQFSGSANASDPLTGSIPSGVSVHNVFYLFDFGVTFGR